MMAIGQPGRGHVVEGLQIREDLTAILPSSCSTDVEKCYHLRRRASLLAAPPSHSPNRKLSRVTFVVRRFIVH